MFEPAGNGYYYIRCLGGQYMDVEGFNATSGGNIHSWQFTGADNQKFKLVRVLNSATGAIAPAASKGTYTNCCYLSGGTGDPRATAFSAEECKSTLVSKMNSYIMQRSTSSERTDWLYWTVDERRGYALPDLVNLSQFVMQGSGTAKDPYCISDSEQLNDLANDLKHGIDYSGMYFKLTASISYTGSPLGTNGAKFAGIFDGDYHTLTVQIKGGPYTALFSELNGATVKNLSVAGTVSGADCVGGVAGHAYGGAVIDNCHVTATVTGTAANVGGIVGMANGTVLSNCRVDGTVTGSQAVGGIVGWLHSSGKVINCVSAEAVVGDTNVGGIAGLAQWGDGKILNCSALGSTDVRRGDDGKPLTPTAGTAFGGILGCISRDIDSMTILNCFCKCTVGGNKYRGTVVGNNEGGIAIRYYTETNAKGNGVTTLFYMDMGNGVSATVGSDPTANLTAKATRKAALKLADTNQSMTDYAAGKSEGDVALTAWTFDEDKLILYPKNFVCASAEIRGNGTVISPYLISIPENLYTLADNVCAGEDYAGKYFRVTRNFTYEGPRIGKPGRPFSGIFDGDYHTLKLAVDLDGSEVALFSELCGATVRNLEISGRVAGKNGVAGIGGYAYGGTVIDNCLITATITGSAENCGGVVGMMDNSTVSNCRLDGTVTGAITSTGGIVGGILSGGKIFNCVCGESGKITGEKAVGGILGCVLWGDPMIMNCASLGTLAVPKSLTGNEREHGGIVGFIGADVNSASVLGCFTACQFGAAADCGTIVGNTEAPADKVTAKELYHVASLAGLPVCGTGTPIEAKVAYTDSERLGEVAAALTDFAVAQTTDDIFLTPWQTLDQYAYPRNFLGILSFSASVFSERSLPAVIVVGTGILAGIVTVAVLYVRKKKKKAAPAIA